MANYNQLVMTYLAAWNERNDDKRRALIEQTWTDGGSYVDSHRNAAGHEAIDVMIATAQKAFPGYVLKLCSGIDAFQAYMRFTWQGDNGFSQTETIALTVT